MKRSLIYVTLIASALLLSFSTEAKKKTQPVNYSRVDELKQLIMVDEMPSYRNGIVEQISSYDPTGGNEDGFAGKYSYIREENGKLVLADLQGPGVVNRIWTPTPTKDTLEFYFDGEKKPSFKICFEDLFNGKNPMFRRPMCANEAGGYYCYFPFTYNKSLKIVFTGKTIQFHQIQYRDLTGKNVETFKPVLTAEETSLIDEICAKWGDLNPRIANYASGKNADIKTAEKTFTLNPGEEVTFFETLSGGRIAGFEIEGGAALEGLYKDIVLTAKWDDDDAYAINAPAADYFGYAYGKAAMRGMLIGCAQGRNYSYIPAPFDNKAVMTLKYEKRDDVKQSAAQITTKVYYNDNARNQATEGRFYTNWRRDKHPAEGKHYDFLKHYGKGHYVGTVHLAQGLEPVMTEFFEGDDSTYVDGAMRMHGTGSEDYYNGGWYALLDRWDRGTSLPLHGCLDYSLQMSRTGGYRFYLNDKLTFEKEIYMGIEHGPSGNKFPVDYASVAYFYSDKPAEEQMVPTQELREVFIPKVHPFYPQAMAITLSNNVTTQFIYSGIRCWSEGTGRVRVLLNDVEEGKYKVYMNYCEKPEGAEFSVWQRQKMIMDWKTAKADKYNWVDKMYVGEIEITSQNNSISFELRGDKWSKEFEFGIIYLEDID